MSFQVNIYTFDGHILIFIKTLAVKLTKLFLVYLEQSWSPRYSFRLKIMILENWAEKPPPPFLPFCHGLGSCHTGRIPNVPILQIHNQIPPIQISSIGYQLCQLFKILTYTELQDSGSWCIWKVYRQPYHNTH